MRATKPTESQLRSVQETGKVNSTLLQYLRAITGLLKRDPATSVLQSLYKSAEDASEAQKVEELQQELRAKGNADLANAIKGIADMFNGKHSIIESMAKYRSENSYPSDIGEISRFVRAQSILSLGKSIEGYRASKPETSPESSRASAAGASLGPSSREASRERISISELRQFDPRGKREEELEVVRDRAADTLEATVRKLEQTERESALKSEQIAALQKELEDLRSQKSAAPSSPTASRVVTTSAAHVAGQGRSAEKQ